jgi:hypothetical protein
MPRLHRRILCCAAALIALLVLARPAAAQQATFIYPTNGATNVSLARPFEWTAVPGATVYYLYVGTTPGSNDLVNTGELAATTTRDVSNVPMPAGATVYATIWTKLAGQWLRSDIQFTLRAQAQFLYPLNGMTGVTAANDFRWTRVIGASAYYLYVGTTPGAKDVVDSGETLLAGHHAASLPPETTLFGRLWTRINGEWRFEDITFETASGAEFVFPRDGDINIALPQLFRWTSVPDALAYYLYVGTTAGARDLVDTGEITATSYMPPALPTDRPLFARIWTKFASRWVFSDVVFQGSCTVCTLGSPSSGPPAVLVVPGSGQEIKGDAGQRFKWHSVPGATGYRLLIGSAAGASDVFDSAVITATSLPESSAGVPTVLPRAATLYTTLFTFGASGTTSTQSTFRTERSAALTYPVEGTIVADSSQPFTWQAVSGTIVYYLYVGTTPGAKDVVDTGELPPGTTSFPMPSTLEGGRTYYATLWTKSDQWRNTAVRFTTSPVSRLTVPSNNASGVTSPVTFQWTTVQNVDTYYLWVGTTPGARDVVDSGEVSATSLTAGVPAASTLYVTLWTKHGGVWRSSASTFQSQ